MRWKQNATKWTAAVLVLGILLSMVFMTGSFRPVEPGASIPHEPPRISPEESPGPQSGKAASQQPPEATEPREETTPPEETEPPDDTQAPEETLLPEDTNTPEGSPSLEETQPAAPDTPAETKPSGGGSGDETEPGGPGGDRPGDLPGEGPGGGEDGPEDDTQPKLVTDLTNCVLTFDQLEADTLPFYAYIVNGQADMYLRVKLRNSETPANGSFLPADGRNYQAKLARQENNFITLYIKQGSKTIQESTYVIFYTAQKADARNPTVGEHPPTVTTNLDGFTGEITNRNFTFLVTARTYEEEVIYSDNILVTLDGEPVTAPTGSDVYEYQLYFENPVEGDRETHVITVLAWDDEGNSTFLQYDVTYSFVDTGGTIGTAYILLDATTVGLDPDTLGGTFTYSIKQNEPASYAVLAMLEEFGYEVQYARTPDDGFYLSRIFRGGMMDYSEIPENLWQKILDDEIGLTGQSKADSLGEFDYTQGSGWMYSVNGVLYAGKSLSDYYLSDGDTLYIRFTLAYGKDIGGYNSSGGSYGKLPTYCGKWINGTYIDEHRWGEDTVVQEPTCTLPGSMAQVCSVCGDVRNEVPLEPLGHDVTDVTRQEPTCTESGEETGVCSRCGETIRTPLEPLGHDFVETGRQEPTEEQEGWVDYSCSRCGEYKREALPSTGANTAAVHRRKKHETEDS